MNLQLIKNSSMYTYIPCAGECAAGSGFGVLYKGEETGSPPFFQLELVEGVNAREITGSAPNVVSFKFPGIKD